MYHATVEIPDHGPIEALHELFSTGPAHCMNDSELDGYLTAVAISSGFIEPGEWTAHVWCKKHYPFKGEAQEFTELHEVLFRHLVIETDARQDRFMPLLDEDEAGNALADDWVLGFLRGIDLRMEAWAPFLHSDRGATAVVALLGCCRDKNGEPLVPRRFPEGDVPAVSEVLPAITAVFAAYGRAREREHPVALRAAPAIARTPGTIVRSNPKIGRNASCPCGSGRKFKRWCGGSP